MAAEEVLVDTVEPNERVRVDVRVSAGGTVLVDVDVDRQDGIPVPLIVSVDDVELYNGDSPPDSTGDPTVVAEGSDGATFRGSPFDVAFWLFKRYGEHADAQGLTGRRSLVEETWHNLEILLTP